MNQKCNFLAMHVAYSQILMIFFFLFSRVIVRVCIPAERSAVHRKEQFFGIFSSIYFAKQKKIYIKIVKRMPIAIPQIWFGFNVQEEAAIPKLEAYLGHKSKSISIYRTTDQNQPSTAKQLLAGFLFSHLSAKSCLHYQIFFQLSHLDSSCCQSFESID